MSRSIGEGHILYASDDSESSIAEAREYIARMGLTSDDVRLIRKDGQILVISKRSLWNVNTPSP